MQELGSRDWRAPALGWCYQHCSWRASVGSLRKGRIEQLRLSTAPEEWNNDLGVHGKSLVQLKSTAKARETSSFEHKHIHPMGFQSSATPVNARMQFRDLPSPHGRWFLWWTSAEWEQWTHTWHLFSWSGFSLLCSPRRHDTTAAPSPPVCKRDMSPSGCYQGIQKKRSICSPPMDPITDIKLQSLVSSITPFSFYAASYWFCTQMFLMLQPTSHKMQSCAAYNCNNTCPKCLLVSFVPLLHIILTESCRN